MGEGGITDKFTFDNFLKSSSQILIQCCDEMSVYWVRKDIH